MKLSPETCVFQAKKKSIKLHYITLRSVSAYPLAAYRGYVEISFNVETGFSVPDGTLKIGAAGGTLKLVSPYRGGGGTLKLGSA